MAKRTRQNATRTKAAARKSAAARNKVATKKTVARKAAKKTTRKTAKRAARKPAKARAAAKLNRPARKRAAKKTAARRAKTTTPAPAVFGPIPSQPTAVAVAPDRPVKRPSNLRKKDLAQFRELLLAKRAELVGDVSTLQSEALSKSRRDASGDLSSMPIHMADLGTDNYEKEFTLGLIEGSRALLREIDEALARIADGTYGICAATGKPIGKARLRARPWAKFCYEYMLAHEKGQQESGM